MSKLAKWITAVIVFVIAGAVAAFFIMVLPRTLAENTMPADATLTLLRNEDGSLSLTWPEGENIDRYHLEIRRPYTRQEMLAMQSAAAEGESISEYEMLFELRTEETGCLLPASLPTDKELTIRISSEKDYWKPFEKGTYRSGEECIELSCFLNVPEVYDLGCDTDPEKKTASITWKAQEGDLCRLYFITPQGEWQEVGRIEQGDTASRATVSFGDGDGQIPMPEYGEDITFALSASRHLDGLDFYGKDSDIIHIDREDMLGIVLEMEWVDEGENIYTLSWNETKGEFYELQVLNAEGSWQTLARYAQTDKRSYSTGHLESFTDYVFRVVALGGQTLPDSVFSAQPAQVEISTEECAIYSTVWPLKDLEIYSDTDKAQVVGKAAAAKAFCVLDEAEGMFYIRHSEGYGYIDSSYCLINLAEYIGQLCAYDITNSYSAIYMVHEYEIPEVTDTVVKGYEDVQLYDESFIVPLLYPVAQKLIVAALDAQEQGYRLKIYDSYRPNMATRSIYDLTLAIINDPIPAETFTGVELDDLPEVAEGKELTYYKLVTNGYWNLGSFLATTGSYHNMGIALDLTLESLKNGEELEMQTSMHDLSWYSVISENNSNANTLDKIMKGAGFAGLTSEWWHFQDNATRDSMGLNIFMWSGVGPECWMRDAEGWRYRKADGSYYTEIIVEIDGVDYIFDERGYATERN